MGNQWAATVPPPSDASSLTVPSTASSTCGAQLGSTSVPSITPWAATLTKYAYPPPVTRCILTQFRRLLQAVLSHLMACGERFARSPTPLPYPTAASRVDV